MVYGEVGKLPLEATADKRIVSYWLRLLNKNEDTFVYMLYNIALQLFNRGECKTMWLCRIKCILDNCGLYLG